MADVYIWVRSTVDWADPAEPLDALVGGVRKKVVTWNETFEMSYFAFRRRVVEIARLNQSRVEGAVVAEWEQIPEGALVVPTDDDDWFAPDLVSALSSLLPAGAIGFNWKPAYLEVPIDISHVLHLAKLRFWPGARRHWICTSNNYALRKSAEAKPVLASHVAASEWAERGGVERMAPLGVRLSVQNRTLASQTAMGVRSDEVSPRVLLLKRRAYRRLYRRADLNGVAWARPYAEMMAELMAELEPRRG